MDIKHIKETLNEVKQASDPGKVEDGTRVHIRYQRMPGAKVTARAKAEAERAKELELPMDSYTGRVSRVWTSKAGDLILNMFVELERDHQYRSFNVDKGVIKNIVVLGD
jgi:hypothetical protein